MKRRVLLAAVCLCASLSPVALAEIDVNTIDLSGLSSAELLILQNKLNAAMWESADWKQVTIQPGILKVGVDIPAGHYTITAADADVIKFRYGDTLNSGKTAVTYSSNAYLSENLVSPSAKNYHSNSVTSIDVDMQAGCYVDISLGCAVFSPYTGAAFAFSEEALTMPPASTPTPKPTRRRPKQPKSLPPRLRLHQCPNYHQKSNTAHLTTRLLPEIRKNLWTKPSASQVKSCRSWVPVKTVMT